MDDNERDWLDRVGERLAAMGGGAEAPVADGDVRLLLRVTKVTADTTGVRYLAPLTAYLMGRAAGRTEAAGGSFDLRRAVDAISEMAEAWVPPAPPAPAG